MAMNNAGQRLHVELHAYDSTKYLQPMSFPQLQLNPCQVVKAATSSPINIVWCLSQSVHSMQDLAT